MLRIYDRKGKSMIAQMYDGQYFPYPLTGEDIGKHLSEMRNMPTRGNDVLISSYPKSGTHWLLEAVHMLMNNSVEYFLKDFPSTTGKADGLPLLEYLLISELESVKSPRLMLSHLKPKYIPKDFNGKIIHLTRNPKDVAVSYYTFVRHLKMLEYDGEWEDFIPLFIEGKDHSGPIYSHRPYPIQPVYPVPCPMVCQISCPFGNVLDERGCPICRCLPAACILPKTEGPCRAAFSRYFYNKKTSRCEHFIWGGCKPNENNFETFHECQATCGGKFSVSK